MSVSGNLPQSPVMTLSDSHKSSSPSTNKRKRTSEDLDGEVQKPTKGMRPKNGLRVITDVVILEVQSPNPDDLPSSADSDSDSLFDETSPRLSTPEVEEIHSIFARETAHDTLLDDPSVTPATCTAPPIPGLFFDPEILLPEAYGDDLMWKCIRAFFQTSTANQVMLFQRSSPPSSSEPSSPVSPASTGLPSFLTELLDILRDLLRPVVSPETYDLLFEPSPASHIGPPRARQAIINLYWPGEGITPHVDLLDRYGDGIIGVSLGSGCAMQFAPVDGGEAAISADADACALYLPKGSVLVMTGEARYKWTHGIEKRLEDRVEEVPGSGQSIMLDRDVRLSITFRWLLPGADVVGE